MAQATPIWVILWNFIHELWEKALSSNVTKVAWYKSETVVATPTAYA